MNKTEAVKKKYMEQLFGPSPPSKSFYDIATPHLSVSISQRSIPYYGLLQGLHVGKH